MALTVGADCALDPMESAFQDQVAALTGDGFGVAFEASGSRPALRQGFDSVRRGATLVQVAVLPAPELSLPIDQLTVPEIQFVGSFCHGNVREEDVHLVASGRVNLRLRISRALPLKQAPEALAPACAKCRTVKVQLETL
jgi:threonine dehydrogenase-like Zn-dependent dehydrogenase